MSEKVEKTNIDVNETPQVNDNNFVSYVKQNDQVEITNFIINRIKDFFNEEQGNKITKYNTNGVLSYLFDQTQQKLNSVGVLNLNLTDPNKDEFTKEDILDIRIKPEQKNEETQ